MRNIFFLFFASAMLSSCSEREKGETGRYVPMMRENGNVKILDTQTGRVYYDMYGDGKIKYIDYVSNSQKQD